MGDRRTKEHTDLTPTQRTQRARIAANVRWSQQDGAAGTHAARSAFMARFEDQVDPTRSLDPAERERRATAARKAHFQRMAYRRHQSRDEG